MTNWDQNTTTYITSQVAERDYALYLACLHLGEACWRPALVLASLHLELAKIRETLNEEMLQQIRFQWWRDSIEEALNGTPKSQPLLQAFSAISDQLDPDSIFKMIEARLNEPSDSFNLDKAIVEAVLPHQSLISALLGLHSLEKDTPQSTNTAGSLIGLSNLWLALSGEYHADASASRIRTEIADQMAELKDHHLKAVSSWKNEKSNWPKKARGLELLVWDRDSELPAAPNERPKFYKETSRFKWHTRMARLKLGLK